LVPDGLTEHWNGWMNEEPDGTPIMLYDLKMQEIYALDVDLT
jgi:hypothetical protein